MYSDVEILLLPSHQPTIDNTYESIVSVKLNLYTGSGHLRIYEILPIFCS